MHCRALQHYSTLQLYSSTASTLYSTLHHPSVGGCDPRGDLSTLSVEKACDTKNGHGSAHATRARRRRVRGSGGADERRAEAGARRSALVPLRAAPRARFRAEASEPGPSRGAGSDLRQHRCSMERYCAFGRIVLAYSVAVVLRARARVPSYYYGLVYVLRAAILGELAYVP